jgi:mRNA interferase MazF
MVGKIALTQGGIYLARLDPAKHTETGKIRPVIVLTAQHILDVQQLLAFICPLSSQSQPAFNQLHVQLSPRDNLKVDSYALIEHCRAITIKRLLMPRLAQLTSKELNSIISKIHILIEQDTL